MAPSRTRDVTKVMTAQSTPPQRQRRVRVWFGEHAIAEYVGLEPNAARYAQAMSRRFASLRIASEVVGGGPR